MSRNLNNGKGNVQSRRMMALENIKPRPSTPIRQKEIKVLEERIESRASYTPCLKNRIKITISDTDKVEEEKLYVSVLEKNTGKSRKKKQKGKSSKGRKKKAVTAKLSSTIKFSGYVSASTTKDSLLQKYGKRVIIRFGKV